MAKGGGNDHVSRGRRRGGRDVLERNGAEVMSMSRSMNHLRGAERNGADWSRAKVTRMSRSVEVVEGHQRSSKLVKV